MLTHNLGYPRIGTNRELKKACEQYWSGKTSREDLLQMGKRLRKENWLLQRNAGIDLIPSNDFSFYDHVLDMSLTVGAIPMRYHPIKDNNSELDLYFAMARGYQKDGLDITAMEMTKWFDTNYHYIVPEFHKHQTFKLSSSKIVDEFYEAKQLGIITKPVIVGPVSYLLLGKEKQRDFHRIDLIKNILPIYFDILKQLMDLHIHWVQFDEPFLVMDLTEKEKEAFTYSYSAIKKEFPSIKNILATYFDGLRDNIQLATSLPVNALHIDVARCPEQLDGVLHALPQNVTLSIGVVDGRNIWKNDLQSSLELINKAIDNISTDRVMIAPSCSLLHSPCDLEQETNEKILPSEIKRWFAFAKQKIYEVVTLKQLATPEENKKALVKLKENQIAVESRKISKFIHNDEVKKRVNAIAEKDAQRKSNFIIRQQKQRALNNLPLFPTTTIGSFPQTDDIRQLRNKLKKGTLTQEQYEKEIEFAIEEVIRWQEEIGLDVLVHGEFERNDMVEYFGELLEGFAFTENGWVQSYGSRCVKPPIIYGDIRRAKDMTVRWIKFAQSKTKIPLKGMLTGPVTILQWSFVRDDQPRSETTMQIALAIRDEVSALEKAGIKVIQIDEPAIREGLPLRKSDWQNYLNWAVKSFRVASSGVRDETQIHTHMCYSEFSDIIKSVAEMDADVITIETSRSQMELLDVFADFKYPNEIGPGVYDIHSLRVPSVDEMVMLLKKASSLLPVQNLWVNPDCGLKTRKWAETEASIKNMIEAASILRRQFNGND
ncbi:MAG: 5-methyltetrahydropteroyltriglutamate--homocysteine S-methyltransferase [Ignavibacteriaceae bacterium]